MSSIFVDYTPDKKIGTVKTIYIDNYLAEKYIYNGTKWLPICKYSECTEIVDNNILCTEHQDMQIKKCRIGDIYEINDSKFKWDGSSWIKLCSHIFCEEPCLKSRTSKYCRTHKKDPYLVNTGHQLLCSFYNKFKNDIQLIKK